MGVYAASPARQVRLPGWTHAWQPIGGLDRSAAGGRSKGSQVSSSATSAALSLSASPEPAVQQAQSARQRFRPLPAYSFAVRILGLVRFPAATQFWLIAAHAALARRAFEGGAR